MVQLLWVAEYGPVMRFIHLQVLIDSVTAVARQGLKHEFGDIDRFILLAANSKPKLDSLYDKLSLIHISRAVQDM